MDRDRRSAHSLRTERLYLGMFVGQHDAGIADPDLGMVDRAAGISLTPAVILASFCCPLPGQRLQPAHGFGDQPVDDRGKRFAMRSTLGERAVEDRELAMGAGPAGEDFAGV